MRRSFERASRSYDGAAVLQARTRRELLDRLRPMRLEPRVVVDLGAGTGHGARELKRLYPRATVVALDISFGMLREARRRSRPFRRVARVCADAFRLPLADASVGLIFSNLLLQWCDPLAAVAAEIARVLAPEGFLSFSTLGPDTLRELRAAWSAADEASHVNAFLDMHDVGDMLGGARLAEPVLDVERVEITYPEVLELLRDLKAIGAHNVASARSRGLTGRRKWRAMTAAYEAFRRDGRLPASYEVVYGAAWGGQPRRAFRAAADSEGEISVPTDSIRRHRHPRAPDPRSKRE
ncbi:MAG: malonyl-ACP O-methyltransferase BioC [Steroidobacteraceae bacterium]